MSLRRALPCVCVPLFAVLLGLGWSHAAPKPAAAKPDLAVGTITLGGTVAKPDTKGRLRVQLSAAAAAEQLLGTCRFPWSVAITGAGTAAAATRVSHEVWVDDRPLWSTPPRALAPELAGTMGLVPGTQTFRVALDTQRGLAESNERNNSVEVTVELTGTCSSAKPTYAPATRSRFAAVKAKPSQVTKLVAEADGFRAVPELQLPKEVKTVEQGLRALEKIEIEKAKRAGRVYRPAPKPRRLALRAVSYFLPELPNRFTNAAEGWQLELPSWDMRTDETLLFHIGWGPREGSGPLLKELATGDRAIALFDNLAAPVNVHWNADKDRLEMLVHRALLDAETTWPKQAAVLIRHGDAIYASESIWIHRGPTYDYYTQQLAPTFTFDRCTSCHSVGSKTAIREYHGARGVSKQLFGDDAVPQNPDFCMSCHRQAGATDWRSPHFDQGLDFSQMNAQQICATMTSNMTPDKLWEHFLYDPRIHWAVNSGRVPLGHDTKDVLYDGAFGVDEFLMRISGWVRHGAPCP